MENKYLTEIGGILQIKQEYLDKLKELKEQSDSLGKELKTLSSAITNEIKEQYDQSMPLGDYNFVVKGGYYSYEFDLERLRNERPDLFLEYVKPTFVKQSYVLQSTNRKGEQNV